MKLYESTRSDFAIECKRKKKRKKGNPRRDLSVLKSVFGFCARLQIQNLMSQLNASNVYGNESICLIRIFCEIRHFSQNRHLYESFAISFDMLLTMAIVRHFCHFRQNHHLQKGPFAILFHMLLTMWRLIAISAIFAKIASSKRDPSLSHLICCKLILAITAIFAKIATFKTGLWPSYLICC